MQFLRKLLGLRSDLEKKKDRLQSLKAKAAKHERVGNLVMAASFYHDIEMLETEIEEASD